MVPFKNRAVYLPKMKGSYSIKAILPALIPEMSYDSLEIGNGEMASRAYEALVRSPNPEMASKTRQNLLDYCKLA